MSTVRLQIVTAIATALGTATGLQVYRNLDFALEDRNTPALVVISGEDRTLEQSTVGLIDSELSLTVGILVAQQADPEAAADTYEAQVHAALMASAVFGGHDVYVQRSSATWEFDLGDCASRTMNYRLGYRTAVTNLEV